MSIEAGLHRGPAEIAAGNEAAYHRELSVVRSADGTPIRIDVSEVVTNTSTAHSGYTALPVSGTG